MGKPSDDETLLVSFHHEATQGTRGSETSQYPEERRTSRLWRHIPPVAASEKGRV